MAQFVECVCGERVKSPPPDNCPACGNAYDPEMVRVQREVHGVAVGPDGTRGDGTAPASEEGDEETAEFIRKALAGELTLTDLADEDIVAIAVENFDLVVPEDADRDAVIALIHEAIEERRGAAEATPEPSPDAAAKPTPRAMRKPQAAAGK